MYVCIERKRLRVYVFLCCEEEAASVCVCVLGEQVVCVLVLGEGCLYQGEEIMCMSLRVWGEGRGCKREGDVCVLVF